MIKLRPQDWKLFIIFALVLNSPPLLVRIPIVGIFAFLPSLFWVNIPGLLLEQIGVPFFDVQEFGAIPKGPFGWLLIITFWLVVAFILTRIIKRKKSNQLRGT